MAKLSGALVFVFLVQFSLVLAGVSDIPGTTLYTFLTNPSGWDLSTFLSSLFSIMSLAGLGGIVYGTLFRNDLVTFAGISLVFASFGQAMISLWLKVSNSFSPNGNYWATLLISPIILIYVLAVISFWRGQSD